MKVRQKKMNHRFLFLAVLLCVLFAGGIVLSVLYVLQMEGGGEKTITVRAEEELQEEIPEESFPFSLAQTEEETAPEVINNSKYGSILADTEYMEQNNIYAREGSRPDEVTISFAGDVMFDDSYSIMNAYRSAGGSADGVFSEELLQEMRQTDLFMLNHESTFTARGEPIPEKAYTFRGNPENVRILADMGVDIVSQANNHSYDYGEISLTDTLDTLKGAGIPYVGAGRNLEEARRPVYYIINDIKIAFVAATQIERTQNPDTKEATAGSPGVFRCLDPTALCETIREAKSQSDFVVVYVHWGSENTTEIDWAQRDHAPEYAKAGADLIIGNHPHCLQGITYVGNTPVIYSLGNFWFNSKTIDTGILKITLTKEGLKSCQFLPCLQSNCRTVILNGNEKDRVMQLMRELSPKVQLDKEGFISQK